MKCEPYQLAIITKSVAIECVGKIVMVFAKADPSVFPTGTWNANELVWIVQSCGAPFKIGDDELEFALFADNDLSPLPDEFDCVEDQIESIDPLEKKEYIKNQIDNFFKMIKKNPDA